jgi:hypothetical protein
MVIYKATISGGPFAFGNHIMPNTHVHNLQEVFRLDQLVVSILMPNSMVV